MSVARCKFYLDENSVHQRDKKHMLILQFLKAMYIIQTDRRGV
jgi:hypothetical protein